MPPAIRLEGLAGGTQQEQAELARPTWRASLCQTKHSGSSKALVTFDASDAGHKGAGERSAGLCGEQKNAREVKADRADVGIGSDAVVDIGEHHHSQRFVNVVPND